MAHNKETVCSQSAREQHKQHVRDACKARIAKDSSFVHRFLLHLEHHQTHAERRLRMSLEKNQRGFTKADAKGLTDIAERARRRGHLKDYELLKLRKRNSKGIPRLAKYWRQMPMEWIVSTTEGNPHHV